MTVLTMQQLIQKVKDLPQALIDDAMHDAVEAVASTLRETMTQQQDPFGNPWPPRKRGTAPVLVHAFDALSVRAFGRTIYMTIRGIEARHHKGAVRGGVQRQMIPYVKDMPGKRRSKKTGAPRGVPPRILNAVHEVFVKHFEQWKREVPT